MLCLVTAMSAMGAAEARRPNIVLIVADDLGFSDLGCYGGEISTPNLDRLAAEGMRFTQFYNCAVCNASRAAMLTGLHPRSGKGGYLQDNMVTAAELLKSAGYATAMSGKWHLGGHPTRPIDRGFEEYYGVMIGAVNYFNPNQPDPPGMKHSGPPQPFVHNDQPVKEVPADYYATDAFADHAVAQIRELGKNPDKPFFLHLAFTAPHYPLQAKPADIAKYKGKYEAGYTALRTSRYQKLRELGLISKKWGLPEPDPKLGDSRYDVSPPPWESTDSAWEAAKMEVYAAMVDCMDQGIGRVMQALKDSGADENTLVLFFSDNGGCGSQSSKTAHEAFLNGKPVGDKDSYILGGTGWAYVQSSPFRRFKTWTYEGGISTPMIARWPGHIPAGGLAHYVTHLVDLMPTFVEITGAEYPATHRGQPLIPLEGHSLLPIWQGQGVQEPRRLGWALYGSRAYRHGRWKIVWGVTAKKWELFDMVEDRTEMHDVAAKNPQVVARLAREWRAWADRCELPQ
ncbi:arylsulfatase [Prosthecobacter sp. SYSU 5D2]|uniref:arylsulfatase n=1 Tax=Prosthecobacter sp. SYSU 5D2 TaxID=3134134 RepID=UPI0031FF2601